MKHALLISTAVAALLSASTLANAQMEKQGGGAGGAGAQEQKQAPGGASGGKQSAPREQSQSKGSAGGGANAEKTQDRAAEKSGGASERKSDNSETKGKSADAPKSNRGAEKNRADTAPNKSDRANDKSSASAKDAAKDKSVKSDRKADDSKTKTSRDTAQTKSNDKAGAGANAEANDMSKNGAGGKADPKRNTAQDKAGNGTNRDTAGAADKSGNQTAGAKGDTNVNVNARADVRIDDPQRRTRFVETIRRENIQPARNIKVDIRIGSRFPRDVRLYAVPAAVYEYAPAYRNYRYVLVDDRICIVDPATYEIVYVVDEGPSGGHSQSAALELSNSDRQFLISRLGDDRATTNVRLRLALGAEVPNSVELVAFPDAVLSDMPKLRDYRYVIVERSIAIVDPRDRDIVLVIEK